MGLNIVVGVTAGAWDEYAGVREHFAVIGRLLDRAGAGQWAEPELEQDVLEGDMWGYSGLHAVRRAAVHLARTGALPAPLAEARRAADDPLLKKAYAQPPGQPAGPFDHLIYHSDCEGYYVPVDFVQVMVDEGLPGATLAHRCGCWPRPASALALPEGLDPDSDEVDGACNADARDAEGWQRYGIESYACLRLIRAARHSVATGAAIAYC